MHITLKLAAFVLAGATLLPSCSTESLELPQEELYARAFIKEFGLVKPSNSFNIATKSNVKVVTQSPTRVKITAIVDGREYLFADYSAVDGSQDISFDLPKGVTDIFIRANGKKIPAKVGGTVNLNYANINRSSSSRGKSEQESDIKVTLTDDILFASSSKVIRYREKLPEGEYNVGKVTNDFLYVSTGPFYIYPVYYNTSRYMSNIIGIYYYDKNGDIVVQDFHSNSTETSKGTIYSCSDLEFKDTETTLYSWSNELNAIKQACNKEISSFKDLTDDDWLIVKGLFENGTIYFGESANVRELKDYSYTVSKDGVNVTIKAKVRNYSVVCSSPSYPDNSDTEIDYAFKGYLADIPVGREFGFFIKLNDKLDQPDWGIDPTHTYFFTEDDLNTDYLWVPTEGGEGYVYHGKDHETPIKGCHAASFTREDGMIRLCFEDWYNTTGKGSDFDLNDMIFYLVGLDNTTPIIKDKDDPNPPTPPVDPEIPAYEWIIAAEDLGNTYDWDFNDMVVAVSYVTTDDPAKKEIKVRPLAAGGTMPVYLMFDNPATGKTEMIGKELHNWLGGASNAPINVSSNGEEASGETVTIEWTGSEDFSLASHLNKTGLTETVTNMGGFWLLVDKEGKYNASSDFSNVKNDDDSQAVTPNLTKGDSYSPQMICLGGQWCWPQEEQPIHEVYVGFKGWLNEPETVGAKWYGADADFDAARVVTRSSLTNP